MCFFWSRRLWLGLLWQWNKEGAPGLRYPCESPLYWSALCYYTLREGGGCLPAWVGVWRSGGGASWDPQQELGRPNINMYALSNHTAALSFQLSSHTWSLTLLTTSPKVCCNEEYSPLFLLGVTKNTISVWRVSTAFSFTWIGSYGFSPH